MGEPVKIVLQRRARPGSGKAFDAWVRALLQSAPALEGSSVIAAEGGSHFILLRFASQADLDRWQASPQVRELLRREDEFAEDPGAPVVHSGFETWFALPGRASDKPPANWKIALVTWVALFPQVVLLAYLIPPQVPFLLSAVLSTVIPVSALTWVVMPRLTVWLRRWLYPTPIEHKE
jgi:antibiotic biosynthesis monooxygenase (ABM) superfamily enzyme